MTQHSAPYTELTPYELAAGFRRLAKLTNDPELAERMLRHAEEAEQEAIGGKKASRH